MAAINALAQKKITKLLNEESRVIEGKDVFALYEQYGTSPQSLLRMLVKAGKAIDMEGFTALLEEHKKRSNRIPKGTYYDGFVTKGEKEICYHTLSYLLQHALRIRLGLERKIIQKGINITAKRLRYDFAYHRKLTKDEIASIESLINIAIGKNLSITVQKMSRDAALATGAIAPFGPICIDEETYVVTIGDFVMQIGDPPYVSSIGHLGQCKILKEKSNGVGLRRIYAVLS